MVMYNGQIVAIFRDPSAVAEDELGLYMLGSKRQTEQEMESQQ
jgi:simple sugar transport system ATP-binding protein